MNDPAPSASAVLRAPCYVLSDAHLGAGTPGQERALVSFLRHLAGRAGSLLINGDLFDFWFEWRHVMPRVGYRVLAALADLRDGGLPILWIAGNHDCWGGELLRDDVGVDFLAGAWSGSLGGWRARVEHGDGLRPREDRPYRALRRVLRHPLAVRGFRALHPDFASRLAMRSSHTSRTVRQGGDQGLGLHAVAMRTLADDPSLELLVFGHSHARTLERAPTGGVYANPGAWLHEPTYLRVALDLVSVHRWLPSTGEGERLDALERASQEVGGRA